MDHKNETLLELFNRRKKDKEKSRKPLPKSIESREIPVSEVKKDLKDIIDFTNKLIKSDYKKFIGKGIILTSFNKSFYEDKYDYDSDEDEFEDLESDTFKSGYEFTLYRFDLWDYPGNPRHILDESNGLHPVDDVVTEIFEKVMKYVVDEYKHKYTVDLDGDWDTGSVCLVIV